MPNVIMIHDRFNRIALSQYKPRAHFLRPETIVQLFTTGFLPYDNENVSNKLECLSNHVDRLQTCTEDTVGTATSFSACLSLYARLYENVV